MNKIAFNIFKILNIIVLTIDVVFLAYFITMFSLFVSNTIFVTFEFKIITIIALIFNAIYFTIQLMFSLFFRR